MAHSNRLREAQGAFGSRPGPGPGPAENRKNEKRDFPASPDPSLVGPVGPRHSPPPKFIEGLYACQKLAGSINFCDSYKGPKFSATFS
jgi:hypothetical protein